MSEEIKPKNGKWRISHDVPLIVIVTVLVQTVAVIIWAVRIDSRVDFLDKSDAYQREYINSLDKEIRKLNLIDDRQQSVLRTLQENARRLDNLTTTQQHFREEMLRRTPPLYPPSPPAYDTPR